MKHENIMVRFIRAIAEYQKLADCEDQETSKRANAAIAALKLVQHDFAFRMFPRAVYFDAEGVCIGAGFSAAEQQAHKTIVLDLPSHHYDFPGPIKMIGRTLEEI